MKEIINKWYRNHALVYKVLLFISTTFLIVYLFPKSGKFKYNFDRGKPWQSENLLAPFDFAIKKSEEELKTEKNEITKNSIVYFTINSNVKQDVFDNYDNKFVTVFNTVDADKSKLYAVGKSILNTIYEFGVIEENFNYPPDKKVVILEDQKQKQITSYDHLIKTETLRADLEKAIDDKGYTQYKSIFLSLFFDVINPNLTLNKSLTNNSLNDDLNNISSTRGSIENGTLIISKGELVEGNKFDILKSLESEYESQIWSKKNYLWVTIAYVILVALCLLMLLLFLRKYRKEVFLDNTKVTFIFFNVFLMVLLTTLIINYDSKYVYVVPLCVLPLVLKAFFDARLGLFTHVLTVLLLGFIVPNSYEYLFLQIIAGIVTILKNVFNPLILIIFSHIQLGSPRIINIGNSR